MSLLSNVVLTCPYSQGIWDIKEGGNNIHQQKDASNFESIAVVPSQPALNPEEAAETRLFCRAHTGPRLPDQPLRCAEATQEMKECSRYHSKFD